MYTFQFGGIPKEYFARAEAGGAPVASHHSPQFKISPEPSLISGVEANVLPLLELMPKN